MTRATAVRSSGMPVRMPKIPTRGAAKAIILSKDGVPRSGRDATRRKIRGPGPHRMICEYAPAPAPYLHRRGAMQALYRRPVPRPAMADARNEPASGQWRPGVDRPDTSKIDQHHTARHVRSQLRHSHPKSCTAMLRSLRSHGGAIGQRSRCAAATVRSNCSNRDSTSTTRVSICDLASCASLNFVVLSLW